MSGLPQHEWVENFGYFGHVLGAGGRFGEMAASGLSEPEHHPAAAKATANDTRTLLTSTET
jgi:hypothetical protein